MYFFIAMCLLCFFLLITALTICSFLYQVHNLPLETIPHYLIHSWTILPYRTLPYLDCFRVRDGVQLLADNASGVTCSVKINVLEDTFIHVCT